jgi:hypothetical protein
MEEACLLIQLYFSLLSLVVHGLSFDANPTKIFASMQRLLGLSLFEDAVDGTRRGLH